MVIVFCTTSNDFAAQSYELNASFYLHKPLTEQSVKAMFDRVRLSKLKSNQTLTLPDGYRVILYNIIYSDYSNHLITLYMDNSELHSVYMAQSELEAILMKHEGFAVINRGTIVNMNKIDHLKGTEIYLTNGIIIPVARRRYKEFLSLYDNFKLNKLKSNLQ